MNSALMTACVAASRNKYSNDTKMEFDERTLEFNSDTYYELTVRKYYHFESLTIVAPTERDDALQFYSKDSSIPSSTVHIKTVTIPPQTVAKSHCFYLSTEDCSNGVEEYLEKNLNRYTNSSIWDFADEQVAKEYLDYVKRFYNVDLKPECKIMTAQFCTEVNLV